MPLRAGVKRQAAWGDHSTGSTNRLNKKFHVNCRTQQFLLNHRAKWTVKKFYKSNFKQRESEIIKWIIKHYMMKPKTNVNMCLSRKTQDKWLIKEV
jgi:hypothetical protein